MKSIQQAHQQITDTRTSEEMFRDIAEANRIRAMAERLEKRGDVITARCFRNNAWLLENGRTWLQDVELRESNVSR